MARKLRVLAIAPYEGMRTLLETLSVEFPEIDLTTFVGDLEAGLDFAKRNFHRNYDAVISRGMTAKLLNQLPIPVIEVEISMYDILRTMQLACGSGETSAVVCYADISRNVKRICEIDSSRFKVDMYPVDNSDEIPAILDRCREKKYRSIICDMVADRIARSMGMNSFLINSGSDSIRAALQQVLATCHNQQNLREENMLFRELLNGQISNTVLFDENSNIILSTEDNPPVELLEILNSEMEQESHDDRRMTRLRGRTLWNIRRKEISANDKYYTAFFYTQRNSPLLSEKAGLSFFSFADAQKKYYGSMFHLAGSLESLNPKLQNSIKSDKPIFITGERGTGKESVAYWTFMNSSFNSSSLVEIDCHLMNDRSWEFLLEHHSSPLTDKGSVIYLRHLEAITPSRISKLTAAFKEMEVCSTNKVLFSCDTNVKGNVIPMVLFAVNTFEPISIHVPPLREQKDCIRPLLNRTLAMLNNESTNPLSGADEQVLEMLESYSWPGNFTQFKRVVKELEVSCEGTSISEAEATDVMKKEQYIANTSSNEESFSPIHLDRTLKDIEKDIALIILNEYGGNQSKAAKHLGISRTTLWRLLSE